MPSLLDLRRRIRAVKSTQQITKAMKMISASKLRRAQDRVMGARPFARQMARVLNSLASRVDPSTHPLLMEPEPNPEAKTLLIVVTADKGLCGAFNTNIIKAAGAFIASSTDRQVALGLVGRKGRDFFRRRALRNPAGRDRDFSAREIRGRAADRARGHRRIHHRPRQQRLHRLQRVQVGHAAAHRHRAAAADSEERRRCLRP